MDIIEYIKLNNKETHHYQIEILLMIHIVMRCHIEDCNILLIGCLTTHLAIQITQLIKGAQEKEMIQLLIEIPVSYLTLY